MTRSAVPDVDVAEARDELGPLGQRDEDEVRDEDGTTTTNDACGGADRGAERGGTHARVTWERNVGERQEWNANDELYAPVVRYGMAEHVGGRARMEDMTLAVEDVDATCACATSTSPRAFFGVRTNERTNERIEELRVHEPPARADGAHRPALDRCLMGTVAEMQRSTCMPRCCQTY